MNMTSPDTGSATYALDAVPSNKPRLESAKKAQEIFWNMHRAAMGRNAYGAYLQGLADGNPPYRQSTLRQSGQGWRANFSTNEAKAYKDAAKTPYYDLFASGPTYCEVVTDKRGQLDPQTASGIITEEFHKLLSSWPGFDMNVWQMLDDFVGFGRGWLYWPTDSWKFKRIPWFKVRFPDGTGVDPDEWSLLTIEHDFDPVTLNSYIRDKGAASSSGWNTARVEKAILDAAPIDPTSADDVMEVQKQIRDQDIGLMYKGNVVRAASVLVREWDGSWSHMIVETGKTASTDGGTLGEKDWLYYKKNVADKLCELIAPFMFEVENGSVNGLGGLLRDIADQVKIKNRLLCEVVNNGFLRSTIIMQAQTASSRIKGGLVTVGGGVTLIPEGLAIQNSTIIGDINAALTVNEVVGRTLEKNTGVFRAEPEKPSGNPEPLGATQMRFAQATVLSNSAVNRFQTQLDWMLFETFRRASQDFPKSQDSGIKAALAFQKRCRDRGVSDEQLRNPRSVKAVRVIGNGSPSSRQQLTAELTSFLPVLGLGQRGMRNFAKMIIAARGGQSTVDRLIPMEDEADLASEQDREALQENTSIKVGSPVLVIENDDHMVHLRRHFEACFAAMTAVQQGGPPADAAAFVQGAMPHIVEHIQMLRNPQQQKEAVETLKQLQSMFSQLVSAMQEAAPDQEATQQAMNEIQIMQAETAAKIADRNRKTEAQIQDKTARTMSSMQLQKMQAEQRMNLDAAKTMSEIIRSAQVGVTKNGSGDRE